MIRRREQLVLAMLLLMGTQGGIGEVYADTIRTSTATSASSDSLENAPLRRSDKDDDGSQSGDAWLQLLVAMALVVGLIFGVSWLVKRLGGAKSVTGQGAMQLIARTGLTPKHQLFLVRLGRRLVLVGAGPQGLATLSEVNDPAECTELLQAAGIQPQDTEGGAK